MDRKRCGALLHVSSLWGDYGCGSLGKEARLFVDFLQRCGMRLWQMLPLVPPGLGNSPYQSCCADAFNPMFIDLETLAEKGLLRRAELKRHAAYCAQRPAAEALKAERLNLLRRAFAAFSETEAFRAFCAQPIFADYALYTAIKEQRGGAPWYEWELPLRNREDNALAAFACENAAEVRFLQWTQYEFLEQWRALRGYAAQKGVLLMGDMPIYVAYDSVEVWRDRHAFLLDENDRPRLVAGVPPDYFSADGQLWGNPLYDWQAMAQSGYAWWRARLRRGFDLFDVLRIDHFRAMDRFYAVDAQRTDAKVGVWLDGPKQALFEGMKGGEIVAEDLGTIDDGVRTLMERTGFPGMKVLEFAFDGDERNEHLPSIYGQNCFAYSGTHDNMPLLPFIQTLNDRERAIFVRALEGECAFFGLTPPSGDARAQAACAIELLYASAARTVIVPVQDMLLSGRETRMNLPGSVSEDNWSFRLTGCPDDSTANRFALLAERYGRTAESDDADKNKDTYRKKRRYGALYSPEKTLFRVWTQGVEAVTLRLYREGEGGSPFAEYAMTAGTDGEFAVELRGDYKNVYYVYAVKGKEVVDPYALTAGMNGKRGMIVDLADTDPDGWERDTYAGARIPIVWETHVRDFSVDEALGLPTEARGKFGGFRRNVRTPAGKSALVDYVKRLGVTHVQLLPIADFVTVNEFDAEARNWGYDPQHYFVPEGSYSADPRQGEVRIKELKQAILTLHDAGVGVIMDVVYNHTYYGYGSDLELLGSGYYYRKKDGQFLNASGCGNEIATERPKVRQLILDSLRYWVEEYHIDGFRFDLMGCIDTDTMNQIRAMLDGIERRTGKTILTYGEPWSALPVAPWVTPSDCAHVNLLDERIAIFNPTFRDGLRGDNTPKRGYIQGEAVSLNAVVSGIEGASKLRDPHFVRLKSPSQQICYLSAHDNYTLFDHLSATMPRDDIPFATKLGAFLLFASLGTPFFQSGEEFLRTKYMDANSYRSSDRINMLDWRLREENDALSEYYAGLIRLRRRNSVFADLGKAERAFRWLTAEGAFGVLAFAVGDFIYCVNPTSVPAVAKLANLGRLRVVADNDRTNYAGLGYVAGDVTLLPRSVLACVAER